MRAHIVGCLIVLACSDTQESTHSGGGSDAAAVTDSQTLVMESGAHHAAEAGSRPDTDSGACSDECAATAGIRIGCETRFLYGVNYAWKNWGSDFGGSGSGVSANKTAILADLTDMKSNGADVIRWWMFQVFNDQGITVDQSGNPVGFAKGVLGDISAALALAKQAGVHYNFTIFSFDTFKPANSSPVLGSIINDNAKRALLMNNVIKVLAQAVDTDPNGDRVVAWDIINEPEWAISGSDPYGDPAFSTNTDTQSVTFAQMETFVKEATVILHQNSSALVTVGGAAIKWPQAWTHSGLDYLTFHMYDWVNQYWPHNKSLASLGITNLPVVMGEFPLDGLSSAPAATYDQLVESDFTVGYAGAMGWAVTDKSTGDWSTAKADVKSFASMHPCVTAY